MDSAQYEYTIIGISPLLMHNDDVERGDLLMASRAEMKRRKREEDRAGDDRCPPGTWKLYLYDDEVTVAMPTDVIQATLKYAGGELPLKGNKKCKALAVSGIVFPDSHAAFSFGKNNGSVTIADINAIDGKFAEHVAAVRRLGFDLFVKRARVGMRKHVRVRPIFRQWQVRGSFFVVDDRLDDTRLSDIWRIAGLSYGLCDWRPGSRSPGRYGMFDVTLKRVA